MSELKPCPFCGGEADVMLCQSAYGQSYRIHHEHKSPCPAAYVNGLQFRTEAEAITAWNARAERTCKSMTDDNAWCFMCSECGKSFPRSQLHLAHNHGEINYCPNCGAKVMD